MTPKKGECFKGHPPGKIHLVGGPQERHGSLSEILRLLGFDSSFQTERVGEVL